jgi:hemerythrin
MQMMGLIWRKQRFRFRLVIWGIVLAWIDNHLTGVDEIDIQHRELFNIIVKFKESFDEHNNSDMNVDKILKFLVNYTMFHFDSEEEYMKRIKYKDYKLHKRQHKLLCDKLADILKKQQSIDPLPAISIYKFILDWLKTHVAHDDMLFVKSAGSTKSLRVTITEEEQVISYIIMSLSKIDFMLNDNLITKNERIEKRLEYLKAFYKSCKISTLTDLFILLKSTTLLNINEVISVDESTNIKEYIVKRIDLNHKIKKEKDNNLIREVKLYLEKYNLLN